MQDKFWNEFWNDSNNRTLFFYNEICYAYYIKLIRSDLYAGNIIVLWNQSNDVL